MPANKKKKRNAKRKKTGAQRKGPERNQNLNGERNGMMQYASREGAEKKS